MSSTDPADAARPIEPTNVTVVIHVDGHALPVARVRAPACDLTLVAQLLRLRMHVSRLGWAVELTEVDDRLSDLFEFIGFAPDGGPPGDDQSEDDDDAVVDLT